MKTEVAIKRAETTPIPPQYEDAGRLETPDGCVCQISARDREGRRYLSFRLMREFDRNGKREATPWMDKRHIPSLRKLLDEIETSLETREDETRTARSWHR